MISAERKVSNAADLAAATKDAGGSVSEIDINGGIVTHGRDISPIETLGSIGALRIVGGVKASGGTAP